MLIKRAKSSGNSKPQPIKSPIQYLCTSWWQYCKFGFKVPSLWLWQTHWLQLQQVKQEKCLCWALTNSPMALTELLVTMTHPALLAFFVVTIVNLAKDHMLASTNSLVMPKIGHDKKQWHFVTIKKYLLEFYLPLVSKDSLVVQKIYFILDLTQSRPNRKTMNSTRKDYINSSSKHHISWEYQENIKRCAWKVFF